MQKIKNSQPQLKIYYSSSKKQKKTRIFASSEMRFLNESIIIAIVSIVYLNFSQSFVDPRVKVNSRK